MKTQAIFNCFVGARGAAAGGYAVSIGRDCLVGREDLWDSGAAAGGFRSGFRLGSESFSRGGYVCAFTYDYVKAHPEHPAPHDLSASQSEAARSECVVIDVTKCGFQSGFGEMSSISFYLESAIACGFRVGFGEMASISTRGGHVRAFTYNYVKTRPEHPAPHDLLSSGSNKVCFATTPPDMEASCIKKQQSGYTTRYTFSAKEKDDETQYSYFGARYYDSDLSVWLSVDPMAKEYPGLSPYMYVAGNPIKLVDPDGERIFLRGSIEQKRAYVALINQNTSNVRASVGFFGVMKIKVVDPNKTNSSFDQCLLDSYNNKNVKVTAELHDYNEQENSEFTTSYIEGKGKSKMDVDLNGMKILNDADPLLFKLFTQQPIDKAEGLSDNNVTARSTSVYNQDPTTAGASAASLDVEYKFNDTHRSQNIKLIDRDSDRRFKNDNVLRLYEVIQYMGDKTIKSVERVDE